MDLLDDLFSESADISPTLAPISPALAQRKIPETGHLIPFSPFSPTPTVFPLNPKPEGATIVRIVQGITPKGKNYLRGDNPGWIPLTPSRQSVKREKTTRMKPSAVALEWLREHRQELRQA